MLSCHGRMAIQRQILVKLVDVEGLHVADHLTAQFRDVHIAEVDVLSPAFHQTAPFMLQFLLAPVVKVRLRGGRWGRGPVGLP